MPYPTPKQIMASCPRYPPRVIEYMKWWKTHRWPLSTTTEIKRRWIAYMVMELSLIYDKPFREILNGKSYRYSSELKTIYLGSKPSIISALHELGHHLYGPSELKACRFSVHLFKKTFPETFKKLKWKGHMLIINR